MSNCCSELSRLCNYRRRPEHTYVYLYAPKMSNSSSVLLRCLTLILFAFSLAIIVMLVSIIIYYLKISNSNVLSLNNLDQNNTSSIARKRQLPDFVNTNIDPCEHFYDFVCDKLKTNKNMNTFTNHIDSQSKWKYIQQRIHDNLMLNRTSSISQFYQLCQTQSSSFLLNEFESYFTSILQHEPYRSYLTLFNRIDNSSKMKLSKINFQFNPFFQIISSINQTYSTIKRINRRPLPSIMSIFTNLTILNQTALTDLIKFDTNYQSFVKNLNNQMKFYENEYNQDSLIVKRIISYSNYKSCLSSLNESNGLKNLIELFNYFLKYRLSHFNTKLMDKDIRILEKINDNHTLIEHLRRIQLELKIIEQLVPINNQTINSTSTCIINLLDRLLDKQINLNELPIDIHFYIEKRNSKYFISNDWPYIIMLYEHILKPVPIDTLVNFIFFDHYRHMIYPYYQPHIELGKSNSNTNLLCSINNCFDILACYHSSFINQLIDENNQISFHTIKQTVQNIINRFVLLIEQSDHLYLNEKEKLIYELNSIQIHIEHSSNVLESLPEHKLNSYFEYVQLFSLLPYDEHEYSYYSNNEPIYYSTNRTLFLPYGFIYLSNNSFEYSLIKYLLKILTNLIQSNPFYIECLRKTFDNNFNTTIIDTNNENLIYFLFRSKFLQEQNILLDEYLWPYMSTNSLMKTFLIEYTAKNYCQNINTFHLFHNNTYLINDVYLVFHCYQSKNSIRQLKCMIN